MLAEPLVQPSTSLPSTDEPRRIVIPVVAIVQRMSHRYTECYRGRKDPYWQEEINRIAARYGVDPEVLMDRLRRGLYSINVRPEYEDNPHGNISPKYFQKRRKK